MFYCIEIDEVIKVLLKKELERSIKRLDKLKKELDEIKCFYHELSEKSKLFKEGVITHDEFMSFYKKNEGKVRTDKRYLYLSDESVLLENRINVIKNHFFHKGW